MLRPLLALSLCLAAHAVAGDVVVYNATPDAFRLESTEPNGKVSARKLGPASPAASSEHLLFAAGTKDVPLTLWSDLDEVVWKGTAHEGEVLVIVPGAKGATVWNAGFYGGSSEPNAALFANVTGEALSLDLEGNNGQAAVRQVPVGSAFEAKKPVRLDAKESTWSAMVKLGEGDVKKLSGSVLPSRYYLLYKNVQGTVQLLMLGNLKR